jgi:hypothetical protein
VAKANPMFSVLPPPRVPSPPEDKLVSECETQCALELGVRSTTHIQLGAKSKLVGLFTEICRKGKPNVCDSDTGASHEICNCISKRCQLKKITCGNYAHRKQSLAEMQILAENEPICCHSAHQVSTFYFFFRNSGILHNDTTNDGFDYYLYVKEKVRI